MVSPLRAGELGLSFFFSNLFFLLLDSMGKGIHHVIGVAIVRKKKKLASAVKALHCCNIFRISHKKNLLEQKGNFNSWNERSIQVVSRKNNKSSILVSKVCRYLGRNVSDIYKSIGHIHLPLDRAILFIIQYLFMIVFGEVLVHIWMQHTTTSPSFIKIRWSSKCFNNRCVVR